MKEWWMEFKENEIVRLVFMPITVPIAIALLILSIFYRDDENEHT